MSIRLRLACRLLACSTMLLTGVWTCAAQGTAAAAPDPQSAGQPAAVGQTASAGQPDQPDQPDQNGEEPEQKSEQVEATSIDGFRMGSYVFKPSGRVKLDVIRDFKPIGSEDSFDPRTIPVDGSDGTNSNVHAKETRLNLDIRGIADNRELRMFIETDFYGSSSVLRLRHAYGSWGGLLAGQTWSAFVDEDNMPRTIDFESPLAFPSVRQAQARWTQKIFDGKVTWAASVEDNKSAVTIPTDVPGKAEYPMPDIVTRFRFELPGGHVTTSAFLGEARFRPTEGEEDSVRLWGMMVSAKMTTFGKDYIYGVFTGGEGIGRYRGGATAVPDETGALHAVGGAALMAGYEHFWNERWSTNGTFSVADTSDEPFYTAAVNKRLTYGAVNLLYWFLGDRAWTGVEYIYGARDVFDEGAVTGSAHRVQYAVRFNLP
jgi:DcaP outer membrane protein